MKKLLLCTLLAASSIVNAKDDYFYFWADSYEAHLDVDGSAFVLMNLKTSTTNKFDLSVNEKIIAKDYTVFENEITQFPIQISSKYTTGKEIMVCAHQKDAAVFQNVVCAKIDLVK